MPDTVDITDILGVDVTPLASGFHATSCPDLSVAKPMSIDPSAYYIVAESGARREFRSPSMSADFDDRRREIRDPSTSTSVDDVGAYSRIRNPSLVPSVWPTSLGDTASGEFPLTALGRYMEPDDLLAQAQDRFWTRTIERDRGVGSGSDLSLVTYAKLDSRSALDRYFVEEGTRKVVLLLLVQVCRLDLALGPGEIQALPKVVHVLHLIQASCHPSSRSLGLHHQGLL